MVFLKKQRARVLAVALLIALVVPATIASADYFEIGARTTGTAMNGFAMTKSASDSNYNFIYYNAIQRWKNISLRVTPYLYEVPREEWIPGTDKYFIYNAATVGDAEDLTLAGITRVYSSENGVLRDMERRYPDTNTGSGVLHLNCWHTRDWEMCTVALFEKPIQFSAIRDQTDLIGEFETTAIHEIGHALHLTHPPKTILKANGEGTGSGRNHYVPLFERSVMAKRIDTPVEALPQPVTSPTQYDRTELRSKWGI